MESVVLLAPRLSPVPARRPLMLELPADVQPRPSDAGRSLDNALTHARAALLARQSPEGYWCAELQGDSILESEYILLMWILGKESDPNLPLIANYLRNIQQPDGGWNLFPGGPADVSGTVKGSSPSS